MKKLIILPLSLLFLLSCASHQVKYHSKEKDGNSYEAPPLPQTNPVYSLYVVGDAGYRPDGNSSPALLALKDQLQKVKGKSGAIFLGDNIYPKGMPPKSDKEARAEAEANIDQQIDAVVNYEGDVFFIAGNHDWLGKGGSDAVDRQERYIQKKMGRKVFHPNDGCPGPVTKKLSDEVVMILIDSEWFLQHWDGIADFNEQCELKTREEFLFELGGEIRKNQYKRVVIALHHPIYTYGPHGGRYSFKDHLFPLTMGIDFAYLPMPIVGSLFPFIRRQAGIREDIRGQRYRELRDDVLAMSGSMEDVIFISGHEHNLQYVHLEDQHFIVSGSGAKENPVAMGEGSLFSYGRRGYSVLHFYEGGESWLEFYKTETASPELLYRKKITDPLPKPDLASLPFGPPLKHGSITKDKIYHNSLERSGMHYALLGKHYSPIYEMLLEAPVMDLSVEKGGLTPLKRGGGFQTNSLRLEDEDGKQWVLRAMRKDATRLLPKVFSKTFATKMIDYQFTTAHPLSAFVIPPMAEAIGVLHTKPKLVYVPKQRTLGQFNADHGNKLYLFEERPAGNRKDRPNLGSSKNIISTGDVVLATQADHDSRIDQRSVIRVRMFDILIGDWDRHDDQWRWAEFKEEGKKIYRPVPRDRDQAFAIFDGFFLRLARFAGPGASKFQSFDYEPANIKFMNYNGRYFDRSFLTGLSWEDWREEIRHIQANLSDELIESALRSLPSDVYEFKGREIEDKLKYRRDHLEETGREYYEVLARAVDVTGTEKDDLFEVIRKSDGDAEVSVYDVNKQGQKKDRIYHRTFHKDETKEIRLYGLDGEDVFHLSGNVNSGIKTRIIGGADADTIRDQSSVGGMGKKTWVYDYIEGNTLEGGTEIKSKLSKRYDWNTYNRKAFRFNYSLPLPTAAFNPDNGFQAGLAFGATRHAFKKDPYASRYQFSALYSFETKGFLINMRNRWTDVVGQWDLATALRYSDPLFTNNFFGFGNDTEEPVDDKAFNRLNMEEFSMALLFEKELNRFAHFHIGPLYQNIGVERTEDRFIAEAFGEGHPVFDKRNYLGFGWGFRFENIDPSAIPNYGVQLRVNGTFLRDMDGGDYGQNALRTAFSMYLPIDPGSRLILASNLGGRFNFNDDYLAYHAEFLGGKQNLRGFRNERFSGKSVFYHNLDLRWKMLRLEGLAVPTTVGLYAGFDYGRVWYDGEDSETWHTDAGGGFWFSPFDMVVIKAGYFQSMEEGRILFGMGFDF